MGNSERAERWLASQRQSGFQSPRQRVLEKRKREKLGKRVSGPFNEKVGPRYEIAVSRVGSHQRKSRLMVRGLCRSLWRAGSSEKPPVSIQVNPSMGTFGLFGGPWTISHLATLNTINTKRRTHLISVRRGVYTSVPVQAVLPEIASQPCHEQHDRRKPPAQQPPAQTRKTLPQKQKPRAPPAATAQSTPSRPNSTPLPRSSSSPSPPAPNPASSPYKTLAMANQRATSSAPPPAFTSSPRWPPLQKSPHAAG